MTRHTGSSFQSCDDLESAAGCQSGGPTHCAVRVAQFQFRNIHWLPQLVLVSGSLRWNRTGNNSQCREQELIFSTWVKQHCYKVKTMQIQDPKKILYLKVYQNKSALYRNEKSVTVIRCIQSTSTLKLYFSTVLEKMRRLVWSQVMRKFSDQVPPQQINISRGGVLWSLCNRHCARQFPRADRYSNTFLFGYVCPTDCGLSEIYSNTFAKLQIWD